MKEFLIAIGFCFAINTVTAQNYRALHGSSYAGALGVANNPASMVNTPFKWDVVLVGAQLTSSTNLFTIYNYSLLSNPANSLYHIDGGSYERKARLSFNLNLLNTRIALNRKSSIAFGVNLRSYSNLQTSEYNYSDTLKKVTDFLKINPGVNNVNGKFVSTSFAEVYLAYARTIADNEFGRLNAGVTVKVNRGLSGGYANIEGINYSQSTQNNRPVYTVGSANMAYGYSSNYDQIKDSKSSSQNTNDFISTAQGGASFDIGMEYLIKPQGTSSFNDAEDYYDYDWKLGVSLLDIGGSQYKYGLQSRNIAGIKSDISGTTLDNKFNNSINSFERFNDSLATLVNIAAPSGKFVVVNPTRLVINLDHYITGNFYINGELSVNVPLSSINKTYIQVKEINLFAITPRWETKRFGVYLPVQFNNRQQLWIGGAFKAGPLLLGFHNLANLFGKSSVQNGGGYLALVIKPFGGGGGAWGDTRLDCPKPVW